jgi:superfamily II DNA or RNA helicase
MRTERPYQADARLAVRRELETSAATLVVMPTGTGKTILMAKLTAEWGRGNVLLLAHRVELLDQARDKLGAELGYQPVVEQARRGMDPDCLWQGGAVLVGSVQTMRGDKRLDKFRAHPFDLILIDEAHHAVAPSYRKVVNHFLGLNPSCKVVGVTATPGRADGTAMGAVFGSCAYRMAIHEAVEDGWLVPVRQQLITVESVDFGGIRTAKNDFGEADFNPQDLENVLVEEEPLQALAEPILKEAGDRQGVVFTAGVAHAHLLAAILQRGTRNAPGRPAAAVDGQTPADQRARIIADFAAGRVRFLTNFAIFTEGWDCPQASLVAMGRPTKSPSVYEQMLGRVLRPLDGVVDGHANAADRKLAILASGKPHALCLDFVGNSRHKLVTALDVLGGHYDLAVIKEAKDRASPAAADVMAVLRKVRAEMLLEEQLRARRAVKAAVAYGKEDVDPFGHGAAPAAREVERTRGGSSDAQIQFLVNLGVEYGTAAGYTRRQASAVIEKLKATRCTNKQRALLARYGEPTDVNFDQARAVIDEIVANGWQPRGRKGA